MPRDVLGGGGALVSSVDVSFTSAPTSAWSALLGIALALSLMLIAFLPAGWVAGAVARRVEQSGMGFVSGVLVGLVAAVLVGLPLSGWMAGCVSAIPSVGGKQVATIVAAASLVAIRLCMAHRRTNTSYADGADRPGLLRGAADPSRVDR